MVKACLLKWFVFVLTCLGCSFQIEDCYIRAQTWCRMVEDVSLVGRVLNPRPLRQAHEQAAIHFRRRSKLRLVFLQFGGGRSLKKISTTFLKRMVYMKNDGTLLSNYWVQTGHLSARDLQVSWKGRQREVTMIRVKEK